MKGRIVIISGPPGAGKSTVARGLAERTGRERAVHLHTDDFYSYIRKGYVLPWLAEAHGQNIVISNALAASAATYAEGGFDVFVDGVVGPWLFEAWLAEAGARDLGLYYVVLRPDEALTVTRATARTHPNAMTDVDVVKTMWRQFANLGTYETHAIDTTGESAGDTIERILSALTDDRFRLRV